MKEHRRINRAIRALALSGCLGALAFPVAAGAQPVQQFRDFGPGAAAAAAVTPTTGAHYEGSVLVGAQSSKPYSLPSGFKTDTQAGAPAAAPTQPSTIVVHQVRTVTDTGDQTVAIVLASAALAIALCGTAFVSLRTTRVKRGLAGSAS